MDIVKTAGLVCPLKLCVVKLKFEVCGDKGRLYRRYICPNNFGRGELICKISSVEISLYSSSRDGSLSYIAHIPVPVPTSKTFCSRSVLLYTYTVVNCEAYLLAGGSQ